jgi:iron uptake system component EfeO
MPFRLPHALCTVPLLTGIAPAAWADDLPQVTVTITDKGCEPAALTVNAGKTVFLIKNDSSRRIEWEILQGVMVVDERENIVPGFVQKITTTLDSGSYGMTCGLLSNPKGTLTVTAKSGALERPAFAPPSLAAVGRDG